MRIRTTPAVLLASCVLAGCGPQAPLTVNLRAVPVTVPRIPTPAATIVEPATTPPPVALPPPLPVTVFLPPPILRPTAPAPTPVPVAPSVPVGGEDPCPAAGSFDVPEEQITPILPGAPAASTGQQRSVISYAGAAADPASGELDSIVDVTITRAETETSSAGQAFDTWVVERTDLVTGATEAQQFRFVHASDSPLATNPGIWLTGIAWTDAVRGDIVFEPAGNGLHLLPDPVVQQADDGVQYVGSATDPSSLTTLAIVRNVSGTTVVDACGALINAYTVSISGTLTAPGLQRDVAWVLQLAPAYGGVDVEQTLSLSSVADGFAWTRTVRNNAVPEAVA